MATFVLIPGAGGSAWYWHRVTPLLEAAGHRAIAVDLPGDDERAGLAAYAEITLREIGHSADVVLVAQSMGGFTAPLVCSRAAVRLLVFVNAMIPLPGETAGEWWGNTGSESAREKAAKENGYSPKFDLETYFLHDVPEDVAREGESRVRDEAKVAFQERCAFEAWPDVPIKVVVAADDRFFPREFQERIARERLGVGVDVIPGGHLVALSQPEALVSRLIAYARELDG
jgi:pimeloyl-ACP methyl ester carboxylesterase